MTLFKNLGSIVFEYETESFEVFSTKSNSLILQFKNYHQVDFNQISQIVSIYQSILKSQNLFQIYSENDKPFSIILHQAHKAKIDKINVNLLCTIIKQMTRSIICAQKVASNRIGQISKKLFFVVNEELRYLYLPTKKSQNPKQILRQTLSFFSSLKNEKQLSHKLLLKRLSKCNSIQSIYEETQYFLSIYQSKQSHMNAQNQNWISSSQFFGKNYEKCNFLRRNPVQNTSNQFKFHHICIINSLHQQPFRNSNKRKFNLFKNADYKTQRSFHESQQAQKKSSRTWRIQTKQSFLKSGTLHIDFGEREAKTQRSSTQLRTKFFDEIPKKQTSSKRKCIQSRYGQTKNIVLVKNNCKKQKEQIIDQSPRKSRKINPHQCSSYDQKCSLRQTDSQSSNLMKQMVNKSLQKRKKKSTEKISILNNLDDKDKLESTQVNSRSKVIEKLSNSSENYIQQSIFSSINKTSVVNNFLCHTETNKALPSYKRLKRGIIANRLNQNDQQKKSAKDSKRKTQKSQQQISQFLQSQNISFKQEKKVNQSIKKYEQRQNGSILIDEAQQFENQFSQFSDLKSQIDFMGVAVAQTADHLKNYQSIFWHLPMFFFYKKFYKKRLEIVDKITNLKIQIRSKLQNKKNEVLQKILSQAQSQLNLLFKENFTIEQSLKKLIKTVKKKVNKQYSRKQEQQNIETHLDLNSTPSQDKFAEDLITLYINSLLEAKRKFPDLVFHLVEVLEALLVWKGSRVMPEYKTNQIGQMKKVQEYFNRLIKRKQIQRFIKLQ